jgi:serine/threonine protein kinase
LCWEASERFFIRIGTFGEVWNCVQRETGAHRAVKVIKIKKDEKDTLKEGKGPKKKKDTGGIQEQISASTDPLNEIKLMCKVDHPNIVRVHETFRDKEHYYIVLE